MRGGGWRGMLVVPAFLSRCLISGVRCGIVRSSMAICVLADAPKYNVCRRYGNVMYVKVRCISLDRFVK